MKVGFDVRVSALCLLLAPTVSSTGAAETVADTKFSVNRGFYVIPFRVKISSVTPDAEIRYTTDGSEPALNHGSGGPSPQLVEVVLPPSSVATPCLNANVSWPACVGERH